MSGCGGKMITAGRSSLWQLNLSTAFLILSPDRAASHTPFFRHWQVSWVAKLIFKWNNDTKTQPFELFNRFRIRFPAIYRESLLRRKPVSRNICWMPDRVRHDNWYPVATRPELVDKSCWSAAKIPPTGSKIPVYRGCGTFHFLLIIEGRRPYEVKGTRG